MTLWPIPVTKPQPEPKPAEPSTGLAGLKKAEPTARPKSGTRKEQIYLKDAVGRDFILPFSLARTWAVSSAPPHPTYPSRCCHDG